MVYVLTTIFLIFSMGTNQSFHINFWIALPIFGTAHSICNYQIRFYFISSVPFSHCPSITFQVLLITVCTFFTFNFSKSSTFRARNVLPPLFSSSFHMVSTIWFHCFLCPASSIKLFSSPSRLFPFLISCSRISLLHHDLYFPIFFLYTRGSSITYLMLFR